jgi:predicted nuclease of predicted toxin-antitoxin system
MKIVADESVDYAIIKNLRSSGFEVIAIIEISPGISDDEVLKIANNEKAFLITADKDFGELTFRLKKENKGILLLRLFKIENEKKSRILIDLLNKNNIDFEKSFIVISNNNIRIKKIITY